MEDLRLIARLFLLKAKGTFNESVSIIEKSGHPDRFLRERSAEVLFSKMLDDDHTRDDYSQLLEGAGLSTAGSKAELREKAIENDLYNPLQALAIYLAPSSRRAQSVCGMLEVGPGAASRRSKTATVPSRIPFVPASL